LATCSKRTCQCGLVYHLVGDLAIYECVAYMPDMSCRDSKRARRRQRQARYEARRRSGVALYPAPVGVVERDALYLNYYRATTPTGMAHG